MENINFFLKYFYRKIARYFKIVNDAVRFLIYHQTMNIYDKPYAEGY